MDLWTHTIEVTHYGPKFLLDSQQYVRVGSFERHSAVAIYCMNLVIECHRRCLSNKKDLRIREEIIDNYVQDSDRRS